MTFKQAYAIAMKKSNRFREFDALVKAKKPNDQHTKCIFFTVDGENVFYYGFDGVEVQKGKHSARRAQQLLNSNCLIIL